MNNCTICAQPDTQLFKADVKSVYSDIAYDLRHCLNCQHFFTSPAPKAKDLDDIYKNKYSYDAHSLIEREKRMRAKNYAKYIASLDGAHSVLEVGCMHGLLLTELKKLGLKVSGVELDPEAVAYCKKLGLNVTQSSIEDHLKHAKKKQDVIVMSHVLEHIAKPKEQLSELRKRMPDNGSLVLIIPNSQSLSRKLLGRYWGYWQVPVHINHFNESSMRELLKITGFKLKDVKYYGADSLFFLSSLANMLGARNDTKQLSGAKKALVKVATVILRPWYHFGNEDMVIVATKA